MTARIPAPRDLALTNWNDDPATYPPATPNAAKRFTGFKPLNVPVPGDGEIITADEQNWLHGLEMQLWTWMKQFVPREWTEMSEGIAATVARQLFRVVPPATGIAALFEVKFNEQTTASTGGNVFFLCHDGERLYYVSGAGQDYLIVASPVDGAEIAEKSIGYTVPALACDGLAVYLGGNAGNPGLRKYDRDGNFDAAGGAEFGHNLLASNGVFAVGCLQATNPNRLTFWTVATPTETGQANDADPLLALAIDADQAYTAAHNAVTPSHVDAWNLVTRASAWTTTLPTTVQPTPTALASDGDYVYCVTDLQTLSAGGDANLYCLNKRDGAIVWTLDVDGVDLIRISVDDHRVWVIDSAGKLYEIDKRVPAIIAQPANCVTVDSDGVRLYCGSAAAADFLLGVFIGGLPTKTYMHASGDDSQRKPFYKRAVPV